ncbi:hypothetical protein TNCV_2529471 [Trichonephila clavipes]|nr:hypothetical protein TNCV_2529471 [Trichonephila clavipes]
MSSNTRCSGLSDSEGIQRLVWPVRSPDLNPIENVWDALGRQVAGRNYPPTNKNTLIRALTEEWDKLPQQLLDNVVQSMGVKDWNALETRRLYGDRFSSRRLSSRKTSECLHRHLRETGSFVSGMHDTRRTRSARPPELEEHVLREFLEQPETSLQTVCDAKKVSQMTVWRVLGAEGL